MKSTFDNVNALVSFILFVQYFLQQTFEALRSMLERMSHSWVKVYRNIKCSWKCSLKQPLVQGRSLQKVLIRENINKTEFLNKNQGL